MDLPSSLMFIMNPSSESGVNGELGYGLKDCGRYQSQHEQGIVKPLTPVPPVNANTKNTPISCAAHNFKRTWNTCTKHDPKARVSTL